MGHTMDFEQWIHPIEFFSIYHTWLGECPCLEFCPSTFRQNFIKCPLKCSSTKYMVKSGYTMSITIKTVQYKKGPFRSVWKHTKKKCQKDCTNRAWSPLTLLIGCRFCSQTGRIMWCNLTVDFNWICLYLCTKLL